MTAIVERGIDAPDVIEDELMCIVRDALLNQPRSLQREIGPSEIGTPCTRQLVRKLAGQQLPSDRIMWPAYIGTCVHAGLADAIERSAANSEALEQKRFLVEHEVEIATVRGRSIKGHVDVFDIDSATVIDWKIVGKSSLARYRAHGASEQYKVQANLYGHGFAQLGYAVRTVMVVFLPREGDLAIDKIGRATGSYVWSQAFDPRIAEQALSRMAGLLDLLDIIDADELVEMHELCNDYFCDWCARDRVQRKQSER